MTRVFPRILEEITLMDSNLVSVAVVDTPSNALKTDITKSQKETILYMGGAILRKLYYKTKLTEERY